VKGVKDLKITSLNCFVAPSIECLSFKISKRWRCHSVERYFDIFNQLNISLHAVLFAIETISSRSMEQLKKVTRWSDEN
jgi:hypothetical protein